MVLEELLLDEEALDPLLLPDPLLLFEDVEPSDDVLDAEEFDEWLLPLDGLLPLEPDDPELSLLFDEFDELDEFELFEELLLFELLELFELWDESLLFDDWDEFEELLLLCDEDDCELEL